LREVTAAAWREVAGLLAMAANAIEAGMVGSPVGGCWQPRCGSWGLGRPCLAGCLKKSAACDRRPASWPAGRRARRRPVPGRRGRRWPGKDSLSDPAMRL